MLYRTLVNSNIPVGPRICIRLISTTPVRCEHDSAGDKERGWFSRMLGVQAIEPMKASHSSMLSDKEIVYELQTHDILSGQLINYTQQFESYVQSVQAKAPETELFGSFRPIIGNPDQAVHIWKHRGGYSGVDKALEVLRTDADLIKASDEQSKLCKKRRSAIILPFSFWGEPKPRDPAHIYELRSYVLKPGTMIEWGNNWARGIGFRRDFNQDVAGFFSQIGRLYMVFHLWAYASLEARKKIREETWRKPGWDTNVAYTVPLIKDMESKIMVPNAISQLK